MNIVSIKAAGFRGVKGELNLTFPNGFAVITGSNGAGKSTVCDAIEYAICGTLSKFNPAKESGEGIAEYVWWRGKERPQSRFVQIEIQRKDGTRVLIERNSQGLHGISEQELLDLLCEKLSRPLDSLNYLCRTSLLRGEQISELSLDLAETERFSFVKACLGARDHSELESAANVLTKTFKTRVERLESEYEKGRFRITEFTSRISSVKSQALKAEDVGEAERYVRQSSNRPAGEMSEVIRVAKSNAVALKSTLDALLNYARQLSTVEKRLAEATTPEFTAHKDAMEASLLAAKAKRDQRQADAQALEAQIKSGTLNSADIAEWAGLHQHGSALGLQNGSCPLCGLELSQDTFEKRLQSIKARVELQNKASADLIRERTKASDDFRRLVSECDSMERQYKDLSTLTEILKLERSALLQKVNSLGLPDIPSETISPTNVTEYADRVKAQLSTLEKHLGVLDGSKALERVAELEKGLTQCQKDSEALAKVVSRAKSAEERFKEAAATVKRVAGELVDERLAELSPLLTELYTRLKPHVDWPTVSYITRGDVRRFLSLRIGEDLNPRFMFSNGQRRAAGLAFLLAVHLSRSWCHLNALVLDDPVQHIDDFRALHLVEVLSAIRQTGRQIICTIEDPELAKLLCRRLRSLENEEGVLITLDYQPEQGVRVTDTKPIFPLPKTAILAA